MDGMYAECSVKRAGSLKIILLKALVIAAVLMCFLFASLTSNKIIFVLGIILGCLVVWFWPMFVKHLCHLDSFCENFKKSW